MAGGAGEATWTIGEEMITTGAGGGGGATYSPGPVDTSWVYPEGAGVGAGAGAGAGAGLYFTLGLSLNSRHFSHLMLIPQMMSAAPHSPTSTGRKTLVTILRKETQIFLNQQQCSIEQAWRLLRLDVCKKVAVSAARDTWQMVKERALWHQGGTAAPAAARVLNAALPIVQIQNPLVHCMCRPRRRARIALNTSKGLSQFLLGHKQQRCKGTHHG